MYCFESFLQCSTRSYVLAMCLMCFVLQSIHCCENIRSSYKGLAEISQDYFQSLPGIHECPADQNPASYMLEIIGAGIGHVAQRDFGLDYQQSSLAQRNRM